MRLPGFIGASYTLASKSVDCQRCINLFPEKDEMRTGKAAEVMALRQTPGLLSKLTLGAGTTRGVFTASDGQVFAVGGNTVYSISPSWIATTLGTLSTSNGPVSIADNGYQVAFADGSAILGIWDINTTTWLTKGVADGYRQADVVVFQDGYFIFNSTNTNAFFLSNLATLTGVTFNGLDVQPVAGSPDALVSLISANLNLWLFKEFTTEIWYDSGNAGFPFQRVQGAFLKLGCAATFSVARMGLAVFWLGQSENGVGEIYMAQGYQPTRISTHAIEQAIQSYATVADAVAYCYQQDGHGFYVLNFPTGNATWVFDIATGLWHERAYLNGGQLGRHLANSHCYAFGTHIVGDSASGKIFAMSSNYMTDDGAPLLRQRISPHITSDMKRVRYSQFQLDVEVGVGLDGTGQGTDPQAILQWSDDFGNTWSNERWVSIGKIGNRKSRAIWRRLGMARDRVFSLKISDPVKVTLIGAEVDFEQEIA